MKIFVFTDVHGSLSCLQALENTEDFKTADLRIFLGDIVFGCSRPDECINTLKQWDCIKLLGNNDFYVCDHIPDVDKAEFSPSKLKQLDWICQNVSDENKSYLKSWPIDFRLNAGGKQLYFSHYAWEEFNNDINVVDSPENPSFEIRKQQFENIDADYYIFGHEHKTTHFSNNKKHYYCLGSSGLKTPGPYLLITCDDSQINLEEKFVEFDIMHEIDLMDKAGYPYAKNKINQ